jgi:hypothetical protein
MTIYTRNQSPPSGHTPSYGALSGWMPWVTGAGNAACPCPTPHAYCIACSSGYAYAQYKIVIAGSNATEANGTFYLPMSGCGEEPVGSDCCWRIDTVWVLPGSPPWYVKKLHLLFDKGATQTVMRLYYQDMYGGIIAEWNKTYAGLIDETVDGSGSCDFLNMSIPFFTAKLYFGTATAHITAWP